MGFVFVLGGARSGKSDLAIRLGVESGRSVTFIATATPDDQEMSERIARHRLARPEGWKTVEAPVGLAVAIHRAPRSGFVIVDCLTLWVSNLLGEGRSAEEAILLGRDAARAMSTREGVVVSNEVGLGIVPASELARVFRDVLGVINAAFAGASERSLLMVAGQALELKPA